MLAKRVTTQGTPAWRIAMWAAIAGLPLLPLVAMRFTVEMNWDAADFAVAAMLLIGGGAAFELAIRATPRPAYRALIGAAIVLVVAVIWADAAVGIW